MKEENTENDKNPTPLFIRIIMYPIVCVYDYYDRKKKRKEYYERNINPSTTDGLGHNHEWEEHKKEGWVYCWICGQEKEHN